MTTSLGQWRPSLWLSRLDEALLCDCEDAGGDERCVSEAFGYSAAHVVVEIIDHPGIGHYVGAALIPGAFLILHVGEVREARADRQRTLENKRGGDIRNTASQVSARKFAEPED